MENVSRWSADSKKYTYKFSNSTIDIDLSGCVTNKAKFSDWEPATKSRVI